ncbi:MAG: cell division protein ZapA [Bacteroidales bacterium]|jgi:cell division protein ZapA (FtsZ GTPase activity inhibitor)|nr:cell division protein ZapA [Bacteroidales bacterium]
MAQDITIKLADKSYPFTAVSPEQEQLIRRAAAEVNRRIREYQSKNPEGYMVDFMSFAALNLCMSLITLADQMNTRNSEEMMLVKELDGYLKNIDKNSR